MRGETRHAVGPRVAPAARHEHAEGDEGRGQASHSQSLDSRRAPLTTVFGVALHVVSFAARKGRALGCLYEIDGFGNVAPPRQPAPRQRRSLQAAGETVLKPRGSSLEHTSDLQRSPAVKEE